MTPCGIVPEPYAAAKRLGLLADRTTIDEIMDVVCAEGTFIATGEIPSLGSAVYRAGRIPPVQEGHIAVYWESVEVQDPDGPRTFILVDPLTRAVEEIEWTDAKEKRYVKTVKPLGERLTGCVQYPAPKGSGSLDGNRYSTLDTWKVEFDYRSGILLFNLVVHHLGIKESLGVPVIAVDYRAQPPASTVN